MKILCVIDSLGSGGAQRQLVGLAIGFKAKGHDVSFLVYHNEDFFEEELNKATIPVHKVLENNYLLRLIKMRQFIRKGSYDSVLSFLEAANFICEISGLPWRKWKLVVGERDANPLIPKSVKLRIYRYFHLLADYVVANSHENIMLVRKANSLLRAEKCKVIYNIVDSKKWSPIESYIFKKNRKVKIVVTASHQFKKNLIGLVEALNQLTKSERDLISIDWYGDKIEEPYIDESFPISLNKISNTGLSGVINFYPATSKILEIVQLADVVAIFSFYEGLPNAICEGMSLGKPILLSNVSDNKLLIYENKGGFLFNPSKPEDIANSIRKLIGLTNSELAKFGSFNRIRAIELFDKDKVVNEYIKTLAKR